MLKTITKPAILYFILLFVGTLSLISGLVYRAYQLNWIGLMIAWMITLLIIIIIARIYLKINKTDPDLRFKKYLDDDADYRHKINISLQILFLLLVGSCFYLLFQSGTEAAIISPWQAIHPLFFPAFILTAALLSYLLFRYNFQTLNLVLFYALVFAIAVVVYRLGFGFDSFIHQATEKLILEQGQVSPKPFYYLGQYGLITSLSALSLPLALLDRLLVPLLAAITLPLSLSIAFDNLFADQNQNRYLILLTLILTFPIFIVTTPQNLAFVFLLNIIILSLNKLKTYDWYLLSILAAAALITQPIAGIPALLFVTVAWIKNRPEFYLRGHIVRLLYLAGAAALPVAFLLLNKLQGSGTLNPVDSRGWISRLDLSLSFPGQETLILNLLYFFGDNLGWLIALLILAGLWVAYRFRSNCRFFSSYFFIGLGLIISYIITRQLEFDFLIEYERGDYSQRILITAILFFLPFIWLALAKWVNLLSQKSSFYRYTFLALGALAITASLYFSYPRFDHYHNSHGYSVSAADIKAVEWIDQDAQDGYAVLANQQVSAASLKVNGFKKYFNTDHGPVFYYPIPTGGPLYQIYLDMVYEQANRATALKAAGLTGVDTVYFVLNKYWWASPKIANEAKQEAEHVEDIDQGEILIYKYEQ